ncbi:hypothetical protein [Demequina sp.]|uniref:hypothetical protein n=1 Tax=Demequina sp. TaxID=2050685 RepID=UPI0025F51BE2|nr:hypothetical protein [Demequina sp.]
MPPTPEAAPEVSRRARRAVRWSLALFALTLLLLLAGPRWGLLTLVVAPAMAAAAVTSLVMLRGTPRMGALRVMLSVGIGVSLTALLYGLGLLVFRGPVEELAACQERAITESAKRQCLADYEDAYLQQLEDWGLSLP